MSVAKIVPKEDWEIVKKYVASGEGIIVLIPEHVADELHLDKKEWEEKDVDYDCGDEAETWIDIVTSSDHYFVNAVIRGGEDEADED